MPRRFRLFAPCAALAVLAGSIAVSPAAAQVRSMLVEQRWVIRVPVQPRGPRVEWKEKRKLRCVMASDLAAASLHERGAIDFLLHDGSRVRAKFKRDCPSLDFYDGFYLQPSGPAVCAARDVVRSRIGGSCPIAELRELRARVR